MKCREIAAMWFFSFLEKRIRQAGKASHVHTHREVLALDV